MPAPLPLRAPTRTATATTLATLPALAAPAAPTASAVPADPTPLTALVVATGATERPARERDAQDLPDPRDVRDVPDLQATLDVADLAAPRNARDPQDPQDAQDAPPALALAPAAVQALVAQAQAGERAAFARLYELYARKIHAYLRYHLGGRSDLADDLAADVFCKALEKLHTYQFSGVPFSAWLYRIAHNRLVDYLRALPKRQGISLDAASEVDDPAAAQALGTALTQQELAGALDGLTGEQRRVIELRFLEDRSIAATARLMGKHEDAVKQLQVRALRNLRRALAA